jgi:methionyl-tRNA formyltransferase
MPIKTIFAGTPEFALSYLKGLLDSPDFEVLGVITQPDKPSGRKQELTPSPVKILAQESGLKVFQPEKLRKDETIVAELSVLQPDLLIVVAYGQIIPQTILDLFPKGCINVHPSILPKYRGASPIQNTILNGDTTTGVSIMLMDAQMDHGPILTQSTFTLTGEETNESLHRKLAESGVPLLIQTIKDYLAGKINPQPQNEAEATYCQTITKEDGRIDWQDEAIKIKNKIYAFYPWPATWTMLNGGRLKIFPPVEITTESLQSGQVKINGTKMIVGTGKNSLSLHQIQLEGKKPVDTESFIRGLQNHNLSLS